MVRYPVHRGRTLSMPNSAAHNIIERQCPGVLVSRRCVHKSSVVQLSENSLSRASRIVWPRLCGLMAEVGLT